MKGARDMIILQDRKFCTDQVWHFLWEMSALLTTCVLCPRTLYILELRNNKDAWTLMQSIFERFQSIQPLTLTCWPYNVEMAKIVSFMCTSATQAVMVWAQTSTWRMNKSVDPTLFHETTLTLKVETPYHDNDLILTPIISPQSSWRWTWSCPELHMGGFSDGGWQF